MRNCLVVLALVAGCGDNSRSCGPGTRVADGVCVPTATCGFGTKPDPVSGECVPDGSVVCSAGTLFDPLTGQCEIDPSSCQNGTVLIDGVCTDPTAGLLVDLQEGPEPNGLGLIEPSIGQAGNVFLKAVDGPGFLIHGTIEPHADTNGDGKLDPDVDSYVISVAGPTELYISADGLHGITAGFVVVAVVEPSDPLASWRRYGIHVSGDTSIRYVQLPEAGTYRLAIADARTLFEYALTGSATAAPTGENGLPGDYYVAVQNVSFPVSIPVAVTAGSAEVSGTFFDESPRAYSIPLGTGLNRATLTMPSTLSVGSLVVSVNNTLRTIGDEGSGPATVTIGNVDVGQNATFAVEHTYNISPTPADYTLTVRTSNATPLSMTGATVTATATTSVGTDFFALNLFSFDVTADDASLAMVVSFDRPIVGQLYDSNGDPAAAFTSPLTSTTWTTYGGLVRVRRAGRYYFAVYAPSATSTTTLAVTSSIVELTPTIVAGTPLTTSFGSAGVAPFSYAPSGPWEQFDVTGANTGGQTAAWYSPGVAYGRLDALVTSAGTLPSEVAPLFAHAFPTAGDPFGRIVLGEVSYFVKVNATNPTTAPTATLAFTPRPDVTDLGTLAQGTTTLTGETLSPTTPMRFYLVRGTGGRTVTLTTTPTSTVNTQFWRLARDESPAGPVVNTANGPDVETFVQLGADWTAFVVSATGNLNGVRTFDLTVGIQ